MNDLIKILPKDQIKKVLNQKYCDIDSEFLGFTDVYYHLSQIIPKHYTVIDLGCAYNPQCFWFKEHKEYIAVDIGKAERFQSPNCRIFVMTIKDFIEKYLSKFNLDETFAICSYVPDTYDHNKKLVRENFKNLFIYYPSGFEKIYGLIK